jgi:hypothetical protein
MTSTIRESAMIDLVTAALIAKMASDAVGAFDKIFRGYIDVLKKKVPSAQYVPPPDFAYVNRPNESAFVAQSRRTGQTYQTVTYDELRSRLSEGDRAYIETLTQAMQNYERQWNSAYVQRSMASGMDIGRLDAQLEFLARQMADPLIKVLDFVQTMGLSLDDHYSMTRNLAQQYLSDSQ